jgi:hypothetical protein
MRHNPARRHKVTLAILCAVVSGCGSPPETPGILVGTTPPGASCMLTRVGQPLATVAPTPAIALVEPAAGDITIVCSRQGFADAAVTVPVRETGPSFGTILYGRSAYAYPDQVDIVLQPRPPRADAQP